MLRNIFTKSANVEGKTMNYGYKRTVALPFDVTMKKVKETLMSNGFGILTEINVTETMKKKLDEDLGYRYVILGACNPPFAQKALSAEKDIGLLLPCNIIVYEEQGNTAVSAILPTTAMSFIDNKQLNTIAFQVEEKLKQAVDAL